MTDDGGKVKPINNCRANDGFFFRKFMVALFIDDEDLFEGSGKVDLPKVMSGCSAGPPGENGAPGLPGPHVKLHIIIATSISFGYLIYRRMS